MTSPAASPDKPRTIDIVEARTPDQFAAVAALVREFVAWTRVRHGAQALYRRVGFREVAPYLDMPEALRPFAVFMELKL